MTLLTRTSKIHAKARRKKYPGRETNTAATSAPGLWSGKALFAFRGPYRKFLIFSAVLIFLAFGCPPKPTVPPKLPPPPPTPPPAVEPAPAEPAEIVPPDTGEELFARSERLLAEKEYLKALYGYNEYIYRFPRGPHADKALIRSGRIYIIIENYPQARAAYTALIEQFPDSPDIFDAKIERLVVYLKQGRYDTLISEAASIGDDTLPEIHVIRKYLLMGDAYQAWGSPTDAIINYTEAYEKAPEPERKNIVVRFKNTAPQIDSAGIIYLLGLLQDRPPAGYLMYHLGLKKITEEEFEGAVVILKSFQEKFPDHEWNQQAGTLIEELQSKFIYNRFSIGCLLPLSGRYKSYGYRALKGIELALNEFVSKNGNPNIKIVVKDTGADPDQTIRAATALIEEKVAAVIGPLIQVDTAAIQAQAYELPIITLTQKDQITEIGDFVFRNFFTPQMQVKSLVAHAAGNLGLSRFAILYPDERYGSTFMNLFWDEVLSRGGVVTGVEAYEPKQTDFADPIKKIVGLYYEVPEDLKDPIDLIAETFVQPLPAEEEPQQPLKKEEDEPKAIVDFEAVFIPDSPKQAGLIIPQLAFYDVNDVYLLGTNLWNSEELIEMARQYVQAAVIPAGFFAGSDALPVKHFVKMFEDAFSSAPGFIEAVSYDTAMILLELTNRPEVRSRRGLRDALKNLKNYPGVTGPTSFTETGDVLKELYILRIRGGRFIEQKLQ